MAPPPGRSRGGAPPAEHIEAYVVGHVDFGERDRILRLLTAEHGRVSAVARGVRGSRKRYGGALDTGNKVSVGLRPPRRGDLWRLDGARLVEAWDHSRQDLIRLTTLAYACELCGGLAREGHAEPRLFGLLDMAATLLDALTAPPTPAFRIGLEAKALTFAGFTPQLLSCVVCEEPLPEADGGDGSAGDGSAGDGSAGDGSAGDGSGGDGSGGDDSDTAWTLAPIRGGAAHQACVHGRPPASPAWLRAVERGRRTPLRALVDAQLPQGPTWALSDMIEAQLQRELKSRRVLASLAGLPPRSAPGAG